MKKHDKYCNKITSHSDVSIHSFEDNDKNDKLLQEKNKHSEKSVKPKQKEYSCDDQTIEEIAKNVPKNSESSMDNSESNQEKLISELIDIFWNKKDINQLTDDTNQEINTENVVKIAEPTFMSEDNIQIDKGNKENKMVGGKNISPEIQCLDLDEFRTHIDFFKENKMHQDVLVRFMKAWTSKDARNNIFLTEFIKLKNEKDKLSRKNQDFETKNTVKNNSEPQNQHLSDFQCNIDDFNANKMDKDVFIHAMKKWTSNDTKKIYILNEFMNIKKQLQKLEERAMDVSNFLFEHDMKVKTEIKDEDDDID